MICSQEPTPLGRPGSARVVVTELSGSGHLNPTPAVYEDSDTMVELYLSPAKLSALSGTPELSLVTTLEMCVDTREITLGNFGAYLPKLVQLKMNNSIMMSVRDLGTSLSHLQVLWLSRCSLQDLDGVPSLSSLKELYVAYNGVSDLSQVSMLEDLQLLDLEGNGVCDLVQVQYLGLCTQLRTLTLEGNPVCVCPHPAAEQTEEYCYRAAVRELVPQLRFLDDTRAEEEEEGPGGGQSMEEDWALLRESIKECGSNEAADEDVPDGVCVYSRPSSGQGPGTSLSCSRPRSRPISARPLSSAKSRPLSGSRPMSAAGSRVLSPHGSRPGSADSDATAVDPDASILTHGAGKILFCGNPVQALRARRQKIRTAPPASASLVRDLEEPIHIPEHTYDLEEPDGRLRSDVFAELRAWREEHNKRLESIERERSPQVLTILHSDDDDDNEEEEDYYDDEEGLCITSDEQEMLTEKGLGAHWATTASPDSSFQSSSPDQSQREPLSPEVARLSLSPDSTLSPSPPLSAAAPPGGRRPSGVRARRLQLSQAAGGRLVEAPVPTGKPSEERSVGGGVDRGLQRVQEVVKPRVPLRPLTAHSLHRPASSPLDQGIREPRSTGGLFAAPSVNGHQPIISCRPPDRSALARPRTARAALQKLSQHHTLLPSRGSSPLD